MKTRLILLAALAAALPLKVNPVYAQARTTHTIKAELVGNYDLTLEIEGQQQPGVLAVTRKDGKLGGSLTIHDQEVAVESIVEKENTVTIRAAMPHGQLTLTLAFKSNDKLEGTFVMVGMGTGTVTGTRRKN